MGHRMDGNTLDRSLDFLNQRFQDYSGLPRISCTDVSGNRSSTGKTRPLRTFSRFELTRCITAEAEAKQSDDWYCRCLGISLQVYAAPPCARTASSCSKMPSPWLHQGPPSSSASAGMEPLSTASPNVSPKLYERLSAKFVILKLLDHSLNGEIAIKVF